MRARRANGEGSYDYREKQEQWRWRGYYNDSNGVLRRKELTAKSRKDLQKKVQLFRNQINEGMNADTKMTVKKWCEDIWLPEIIKMSTKIRTYENYKCTIRNHIIPNFGKFKLQDLKVMDIQAFLNSLNETHKASTIITIRNHMIIILNSAMEHGYLKLNVAKKTKPPRIDKQEIMVLSEKQSKKLLKRAENANLQGLEENDGTVYLRRAYYVAIHLALTTGMREGEIFGLSWADVDFKGSLLFVRHNLVTSKENGLRIDSVKTRTSNRKILLSIKTIDILKKWKRWQVWYGEKWEGVYDNEHNLVVSNSYGKPVSITNFSKRYFKKMLVAAGISTDIRFHALRHTHATHLLKAGVNVKVVAERLGHSSTSVTMDIYAHALPDMQESAIQIIDKIF